MEIHTAAALQEAILQLEEKKDLQRIQLNNHFHEATESLKPMNILKNSIGKVVKSPGAVENIIDATVGVGAGLLSKRMIIGKSAGVLKKLLGMAVEFGVAGLVAKNSGSIKSNGSKLLGKIFKSKKPAAYINQ